jgi:molybdopterin/thiamine biosynthesis adenylyltransferase
MLKQAEFKYYAKQMAISQFSLREQGKLKKAKVLVIGAGGLGSAALFYLAAAGGKT